MNSGSNLYAVVVGFLVLISAVALVLGFHSFAHSTIVVASGMSIARVIMQEPYP